MPFTPNSMYWKRSESKVACTSIWLCCVMLASCADSADDKESVKPMVYEGMPVTELENTLGKPDSVVKGGTVYDVESGRKKKVERLHFKKRIVVAIDDTVKVPDERRRTLP